MLLESVRTGSLLLPQIKIIHVLTVSLEVIFQKKKKGHYNQVRLKLFEQISLYGLGIEGITWILEVQYVFLLTWPDSLYIKGEFSCSKEVNKTEL